MGQVDWNLYWRNQCWYEQETGGTSLALLWASPHWGGTEMSSVSAQESSMPTGSQWFMTLVHSITSSSHPFTLTLRSSYLSMRTYMIGVFKFLRILSNERPLLPAPPHWPVFKAHLRCICWASLAGGRLQFRIISLQEQLVRLKTRLWVWLAQALRWWW